VNDLQSADQAFESAKTHYENLVNALKEARKALQAERDDALAKVKKEETGRREDKEGWRKDMKEVEERHRRILADRDQASQTGRQAVQYIGHELTNKVHARLQSEVESARERVSLRDRDLASVQSALRSLEDERRKLGDEHTSDRFSLELEIERVKRDLIHAEDQLDQARRDLTKRDLEVAAMVRHDLWKWLIVDG